MAADLNRDARRPAVRRTVIVLSVIAFGLYALFFVRALLLS
ncbi:MAG: hypothetical protein R3F18_17535 [Lysobacterales bacterium]